MIARALFADLEWTGSFQAVMGEEAPLRGVPNLALRAERVPNATGAELLGYHRDYASALAIEADQFPPPQRKCGQEDASAGKSIGLERCTLGRHVSSISAPAAPSCWT